MRAHQKSRRRAISVLTAAVLFLGACDAPSGSLTTRYEPRSAPVVVIPVSEPVRAYVPVPETDTTVIGAAVAFSGTASWYPASGLIAAAGPGLRVGDWRGSRITVSANGRSVVVVLSDWCQCYKGTSRERLIDLSDDAFSRLAPLSRGVIRVTVEPAGRMLLPATDTEGE